MSCSARILTCNVRYYGAQDGENDWVHRKDICAEVIRSQDPDIICFQEMWGEQRDDLSAALPEYATYGLMDEPGGDRPMNSIFHRSDAFDRIDAGGYWLSLSPHVAGSKSWDSLCVRLANWVRLVDRRSGVEFRVINTHLDHRSQPARENQARLIVEDAQAWPADYPQILTGDMNCEGDNPAMEVFRAGGWGDTYAAVHGDEETGPSFHAFLGTEYDGPHGKIDWVCTRGRIDVADATIVRDSRDGRFPSDHYFVGATLQIG